LDMSSIRLSSRMWAHMKHRCLPQDAQLPKSIRRDSLEPHEVFLITLPILWPISTGALLVIFAVIILSYLMSHYRGSEQESRLRVVTELASNSVDQNVLEVTTLGPNALDSSLMRTRARLKTWSKVAAGAYVAMVLSSVGLYVGSRFLGLSSPSWYPIALAGLNLGSTYLAYRVWSKAREE
jgi:hypothetical protein